MMKKNLFYAILAAVLILIGSAGISRAATYDVTADFSLTDDNPNGVWTYGWMQPNTWAFSRYENTNAGSTSVFQSWYRSSTSSLPNVSVNTGTTRRDGVDPGQLTLHPGPSMGSGYTASVVRFTAPASGRYEISGQFYAGDTGRPRVGIRQGGSWLWEDNDKNDVFSAFSLSRDLTASDTLDFVVYDCYSYGNTPLALTIFTPDPAPAVPVPATLLLFGPGLTGLALLRRRFGK